MVKTGDRFRVLARGSQGVHGVCWHADDFALVQQPHHLAQVGGSPGGVERARVTAVVHYFLL
jgi:hypothetical protein